jgi:hypothetical protein
MNESRQNYSLASRRSAFRDTNRNSGSCRAKRTRLTAAVLAVIIVGGVFNLQAQTPAATDKRAAIQEFLNLIGATQFAKSLFVSLIDQYSQALAKSSIDDFEKKKWPPEVMERVKILSNDFYSRLSKRLREEVPARIEYEQVANRLYLEAYDEYFSESEIRELLAFYKSPIGQRFLGFGPNAGITIQQRTAGEFEGRLLAVVREIVDDEVRQLELRSKELETFTPRKSTPRRKN